MNANIKSLDNGDFQVEQGSAQEASSRAKDVLINTFVALQAAVQGINDRPNLTAEQTMEILASLIEGIGDGLSGELQVIGTQQESDDAELAITTNKRAFLKIVDANYPS